MRNFAITVAFWIRETLSPWANLQMVTVPDDTVTQTSGETPTTAPNHFIQGFPILIGLMRQQGGCSELVNFDVIYCAALHNFLAERRWLNGWISISG